MLTDKKSCRHCGKLLSSDHDIKNGFCSFFDCELAENESMSLQNHRALDSNYEMSGIIPQPLSRYDYHMDCANLYHLIHGGDTNLDGAKGYWNNYYESGRFGSHVTHDDYSPESFS